MTHARDNFLTWLKAAHAMEEQSMTILRAQSRRIESYPHLKERITQHLRETEAHAEALRTVIDGMSQTSSTLKNMAARLTAAAQGLGGAFTSDEVVRGAISDYAFEHLEIATYRVLIAAADELGELEAKAVFEKILGEEEAMAEWLESNLDQVTRIFLMRDERDLMAKR
jgi:ferritin-like metal-binding protein YciE